MPSPVSPPKRTLSLVDVGKWIQLVDTISFKTESVSPAQARHQNYKWKPVHVLLQLGARANYFMRALGRALRTKNAQLEAYKLYKEACLRMSSMVVFLWNAKLKECYWFIAPLLGG